MKIEGIQLTSKSITATIFSEGPRRQSIDFWKAILDEKMVNALRVEFINAIEEAE